MAASGLKKKTSAQYSKFLLFLRIVRTSLSSATGHTHGLKVVHVEELDAGNDEEFGLPVHGLREFEDVGWCV